MTIFATDAAFIIGKRHIQVAQPCQDYARAGSDFVVVSDGCSSGGNTDLGARQWSLAAMDALAIGNMDDPDIFLQHLLAAGRLRTANMPMLDTLATVGVGRVQHDHCHGFFQGDGCIAFDLADGGMEFWLIDAPGNAPLYPQYLLNDHYYKEWIQQAGQQQQQATCYQYDNDGVLVAVQREDMDTPYFHIKKNVKDVTAMMITTDGIATTPGRTAWTILNELFAVQEPAGDFMHRRVGAMVRKEKLAPYDDLAVGAIIPRRPA